MDVVHYCDGAPTETFYPAETWTEPLKGAPRQFDSPLSTHHLPVTISLTTVLDSAATVSSLLWMDVILPNMIWVKADLVMLSWHTGARCAVTHWLGNLGVGHRSHE